MPLYEYECEACGKRVEKIQKYSDPPLEVCPSCGGKARKLFSSPAIQFKGSGWYITDYAKKSTSDSAKAGSQKTNADSASETEKKGGPSASSSSTPSSDSSKKD